MVKTTAAYQHINIALSIQSNVISIKDGTVPQKQSLKSYSVITQHNLIDVSTEINENEHDDDKRLVVGSMLPKIKCVNSIEVKH